MSEWKVVPASQVRDLAEWLVSWSWPASEAAALERAASRGWTLRSHEPGDGVEWDTGLDGNRPWAEVTIVDGDVSEVRVTMSEVLTEKSKESVAFLRDVFVDQVAEVTKLLGPPTERKPGARAAVRWLLPNGSALRIGLGLSCTWRVRSPEFVEIEADLGRR